MADRDPQIGTAKASEAALLAAALDYAARGWPVFPCSPESKRPLLARDKDATGKPIKGSGGVSKASTEPEQIRAWWRKWPRAMIGLAMGHDRLFALDFDPRHDAETGEVWTLDSLKADLLAQMAAKDPSSTLPESLAGMTQSGGVHVWLRWPDDDGAPITNRGNLPEHVDVRGLGGYIIAPPSVMASGRGYRWLRGAGPDVAPIADAPAALIDILRSDAKRAAAPRQGESAKGRQDRPPPERRGQDGQAVTDAQRRWALAALDAEIAELRSTPVGGGRYGGRNEGSYHAAYVLGQIVAAGALTESVARAALLDAIKGFGSDHSDAVENGLARGAENPRDLSSVGQKAGTPSHLGRKDGSFRAEPSGGKKNQGTGGRISVDPDPETDRHCAALAQTDLGNAERFLRRHGNDYRFCPELGWYRWDGRRWRLLAEEKDKVPGEVMQAAMATVRAIRHEAALVAESGCREDAPPTASDAELAARLDFIVKETRNGVVLFSDTLAAHAKASEGKGRLEAIPGLVKSMSGILVRSDAFDVEREAINVRNGTIRIVSEGNEPSIQLCPHRREDLITKMAEVEYDPAAACADYDHFFERIMPDAADRRFLHQWAGLSATGDISHHKMAFFWGKGRNGKSTWVDIIATIMGDYAMTIGFDTFLDQANKKKGSDATPDLARLPGVRFLRASEPEKGAKLAEGLIKEVTGGERIQARHLNKGFFEFLPSFKFTGQGNYRPKISGHDDGIWSRVRLVPFTVRIPDSEIDRKLPEKLRAERSGIFNRMMAGLIDLKMHGLLESANIKQATEKYREASDALGRFLRDCTADKPAARTKSSELFALFTAWAKASGTGEWTPQGFAKAMEDRGYERKTSNGVWWLDIEPIVDLSAIEAGRFGEAVTPAPSQGANAGAYSTWNEGDDLDYVPGFD